MQNNTTTFVPAGTPVTLIPEQVAGATFAMPSVDGNNTDLTATNTGRDVAWLSFAPGAPVGPTVSGCLVVPGGATVLCTTNAGTLAASSANPAVQNPQGGACGTATAVSAITSQRGAVITLQRGTATARAVF